MNKVKTPEETKLLNDLQNGDVMEVEAYLNTHPDFNIQASVQYGYNLLHLAVAGSHDEMAQMLLNHGANPMQDFGNPRISTYVPSPYKQALTNHDQDLVDLFTHWQDAHQA